MKILVLAAHPDDEVLGMGGTIKKFTKNNHTVKIVIFATGNRQEDHPILKIQLTMLLTKKLIQK